jgi:hypothetical protein
MRVVWCSGLPGLSPGTWRCHIKTGQMPHQLCQGQLLLPTCFQYKTITGLQISILLLHYWNHMMSNVIQRFQWKSPVEEVLCKGLSRRQAWWGEGGGGPQQYWSKPKAYIPIFSYIQGLSRWVCPKAPELESICRKLGPGSVTPQMRERAHSKSPLSA